LTPISNSQHTASVAEGRQPDRTSHLNDSDVSVANDLDDADTDVSDYTSTCDADNSENTKFLYVS